MEQDKSWPFIQKELKSVDTLSGTHHTHNKTCVLFLISKKTHSEGESETEKGVTYSSVGALNMVICPSPLLM